MRSKRVDRSLSLRTLSLAFAGSSAIVLIAVAAAFIWWSRATMDAAEEARRLIPAVDAADRLERDLRQYHWVANLDLASRDPALSARRRELEAELRAQVDSAALQGADLDQRDLLVPLRGQLDAYLAARAAAEAATLPLDQLLVSARPGFEQVVATIAEIERHFLQRRRDAEARALWMLRVETAALIVVAALLILGIAASALVAARLVVTPVLRLEQAAERFRAGAAPEVVAGGALVELRLLAERFNEMTAAIAAQRKNQLTYLAAVAHDLKNPLASLKMAVQLLERDRGPVAPARFRLLDRQIDRLSRMIGDLLDAAQIEAGHLELKPASFDLREAARSVVDLYAPSAGAHRLCLVVPDAPVMVTGDPMRIEQVIGNLVSNAIKYSPEGGPVEVALATVDGEAQLSVSDHGVGIPVNEIANVFQPFRRRRATAELAPGVGLGLSIVRRIVDAHRGHIEVESALQRGSTFRVRLPLGVQEGARA